MSRSASLRLSRSYTLFDRLFILWDRMAELFRADRLSPKKSVKLSLEHIEERLVPDARPLPVPVIYVGDAGGNSVNSYFAETGGLNFDETVFAPAVTGGGRVAVGDFTNDGFPDVVAAAGPGGGPAIKILDGKTGEQ